VELRLDRNALEVIEGESGTPPPEDRVLALLRVRTGVPGLPALAVRATQAMIGSDPSSDVVVSSESVSGRHGQLRLRGGVWTYVDFGSDEGSMVDGEAVKGEALLAPGSAVRLGEVDLAFAPQDRWEDSPPERRNEDRAPMVLFPPDDRSFWPTLGLVLMLIGVFVAAYFLLRKS
jgi:hypothetical protein